MAHCHHPIITFLYTNIVIQTNEYNTESSLALCHACHGTLPSSHHHFPLYKHCHSDKRVQHRKFIGPLPCMPWHTAIIPSSLSSIQTLSFRQTSTTQKVHWPSAMHAMAHCHHPIITFLYTNIVIQTN